MLCCCCKVEAAVQVDLINMRMPGQCSNPPLGRSITKNYVLRPDLFVMPEEIAIEHALNLVLNSLLADPSTLSGGEKTPHQKVGPALAEPTDPAHQVAALPPRANTEARADADGRAIVIVVRRYVVPLHIPVSRACPIAAPEVVTDKADVLSQTVVLSDGH